MRFYVCMCCRAVIESFSTSNYTFIMQSRAVKVKNATEAPHNKCSVGIRNRLSEMVDFSSIIFWRLKDVMGIAVIIKNETLICVCICVSLDRYCIVWLFIPSRAKTCAIFYVKKNNHLNHSVMLLCSKDIGFVLRFF